MRHCGDVIRSEVAHDARDLQELYENDWKEPSSLDAMSKEILFLFQIFLYFTSVLHVQDPVHQQALLEMLFSANADWDTNSIPGFKERKRSPSERSQEEDSHFLIAWESFADLVKTLSPSVGAQVYTDPIAWPLFLFLFNHPNRTLFVHFFFTSLFKKAPTITLSLRLIYNFCKTNEGITLITADILSEQYLASLDILEQYGKKVPKPELLFLDPPLMCAPLLGTELSALRGAHFSVRQFCETTQTVSFSDSETFFWILRRCIFCGFEESPERVFNFVSELETICCGFPKELKSSLCFHSTNLFPLKEGLDTLKRKREEWIQADLSQLIVDPPTVSQIDGLTSTLSSLFTNTFPEELAKMLRACMRTSLMSAFFPPTQPLLDHLRIKTIGKDGPQWIIPLHKTHVGQCKFLIPGNVAAYLFWDVSGSHPNENNQSLTCSGLLGLGSSSFVTTYIGRE